MRWWLRPECSSSSASVARRNSRSGAPSNLDPTSSRSALRFLSVNGMARSGGLDGRGVLEAELLDRHLAQLELLDLAGDGHRELVDGRDVARDLVAGDLAVAVPGDRVAVDRGVAARDDPGHQLLAVALVGDADDLHVGDVRVAVEELLDLARIEVLAAADDHVLDAPDDPQVALLVHHRKVARVHPARAVEHLVRLLGLVPVPEHHGVAARAQLARLLALDDVARL